MQIRVFLRGRARKEGVIVVIHLKDRVQQIDIPLHSAVAGTIHPLQIVVIRVRLNDIIGKHFLRKRVFLSIFRLDKPGCRGLRLLRHAGGIGTKISDDTDRSVSLDIHTLVKLLGQTHGLLG